MVQKQDKAHGQKANDHTITIDPVAAARRWIEDALINFNTLHQKEAYTSRLPKSVAMWKFEDYENERLFTLAQLEQLAGVAIR
jgi:hypothetical protein